MFPIFYSHTLKQYSHPSKLYFSPLFCSNWVYGFISGSVLPCITQVLGILQQLLKTQYAAIDNEINCKQKKNKNSIPTGFTATALKNKQRTLMKQTIFFTRHALEHYSIAFYMKPNTFSRLLSNIWIVNECRRGLGGRLVNICCIVANMMQHCCNVWSECIANFVY